jgi:23S rRNA (cytidine1920-2'-O)/16S rRNA (cytidine1409-2'-O)-methyltransferase
MRLDQFLVQQSFTTSRSRAQAMIKEGKVLVDGTICTKPAQDIGQQEVTLNEPDHPYVSRAALKLIPLLEATEANFDNKVVVDVGASTGGFTQLSLEKGAKFVYAVDVGTDQLAETLRNHSCVKDMQQIDARKITENLFHDVPTHLVSDVSFISLFKILDHVLPELPSLEEAYVLVKPQFELTPEDIGRGGLVNNPQAGELALDKVSRCFKKHGWQTVKTMVSPVKGGDGNQEFLLAAVKKDLSHG